jgi:hypothetical protein
MCFVRLRAFVFLVARKNQAFSFSKATGCLVAVVQAMVAYSSAEGIGRTDFHHEGHEEHKLLLCFPGLRVLCVLCG